MERNREEASLFCYRDFKHEFNMHVALSGAENNYFSLRQRGPRKRGADRLQGSSGW